MLAGWARTVRDETGSVVEGAEVEVREVIDPNNVDAAPITLASLWEDPDGTNGEGNPVVTGTDGLAKFFTYPDYYHIIVTNGQETETYRAHPVGVPPSEYSVKTAAYTCRTGEYIAADTSGGAWTLTLPASPRQGRFVTVTDFAGTWDTNNLTIDGNGNNISGDSTLVCDVAKYTITLVFDGNEWIAR